MKHSYLILGLVLGMLTTAQAQHVWQSGGKFNGPLPTAALTVDSEGTLYAGSLGGNVYKSSDGGHTWTPGSLQLPNNDFPRIMAVSSRGIITLRTESGATYSSADQGGKWTKSSAKEIKGGLAKLVESALDLPAVDLDGFEYRLDPDAGVLRSAPASAEWESINQYSSTLQATALAIDAEGRLLIGTEGGHLLQSADHGLTLESIRSFTEPRGVTSIVASGNSIVVGTYGGIYVSDNLGLNWTAATVTAVGIRTIESDPAGIVFAGTMGGGIFRSSDNGVTWQTVNTGLTPVNVTDIAIGKSGQMLAGTVFGGMYMSNDKGNSWESVPFLNGQTVNAVKYRTDNRIFVGLYDFLGTSTAGSPPDDHHDSLSYTVLRNVTTLLRTDDDHIFAVRPSNTLVYRTTDPADTVNLGTWSEFWWRVPYFTGFPDNYPQKAHTVTVSHRGDVYVGGWNRDTLYQMIDTSWSKKALGVAGETAIIALERDAADQIFAGTIGHGVYTSSNHGLTWTQDATGFTAATVTSLESSSAGILYAGTLSGKVYHKTTSVPDPPLQISPLADTPIQTRGVAFAWAPNPAMTYRLQIATDSLMNQVVYDTVGIMGGVDSVGNIWVDSTYYWRVQATNELGTGDWSRTVALTNSLPGAFALIEPAVGERITTLNPTFSWISSIDPDPADTIRYSVHVDGPLPGVRIFDADTTTSYYLESPLFDNSVYNWKIVARDQRGAFRGNSGGYRMLLTDTGNEAPSAVQLITPTDSSVEITATPFFYWTNSTDPDPNDPTQYVVSYWPLDGSAIRDTLDTLGLAITTPLIDNSEYYWTVTSMDTGGSNIQTDTSVFWVDTFPEPPAEFATISPASGAAGISLEVNFLWNSTSDPDPLDFVTYTMSYGTILKNSTTWVNIDALADTTHTASLEINLTYLWKVEAHGFDSLTTMSDSGELRQFTTSTTGIDDSDQLPRAHALYQNHPNPFNPTTTLRFDLPEATEIYLAVYDLLGREMIHLLDGRLEAGYHSLVWNGRDTGGREVPTGMYIAWLVTPTYTKSIKMVLLK